MCSAIFETSPYCPRLVDARRLRTRGKTGVWACLLPGERLLSGLALPLKRRENSFEATKAIVSQRWQLVIGPIGHSVMRTPSCVWLTRYWWIVAPMVLAVILLAIPLFQDAAWVGSATIPLEFLILDASTGRPVSGASVALAEGDPEYRATTGPDGTARLIIRAMIGGRSGTRSVNYGHWALVISADGYKGVNDDLRHHTRDPRYHSEAVPPPIVVRITSEATGQ